MRLCALLALTCSSTACGRANTKPKTVYERVVLVTIDTLRADHLQPYGYARQTSPFIDRLASQGVLFEEAMSTMSHTAPSHASILTGLLPLRHAVLTNGERLPKGIPTLAHEFGEADYRTAAFVSNSFLRRAAPGFQTFDGALRRGRETVALAIDWVEQQCSDQPFFLWVHLFDVHEAELEGRAPPQSFYEANDRRLSLEPDEFYDYLAELHGYPDPPPGEEFPGIRWESWMDVRPARLETRAEVIQSIDDYDAQIAYVDRQIEHLYDAIESDDFEGSSLWVLTSDHGEGLGEHLYRGHDAHIYQEQLHVPLIFYASDGALPPSRIAPRVSLVDLSPTLLELLDGEETLTDGVSLWPLLRGEEDEVEPHPLFALRKKMPSRENCMFTLVEGSHKYILHTELGDQFFDLDADPEERVNLIDTPEAEAFRERLEAKLGQYRWEELMSAPPRAKLSEELTAELEALGYLGDE